MNPDKLEFDGYVQEILHTGSRVICDPSPMDTDDDYMLYVYPENVGVLEDGLIEAGFVLGGSFDPRRNRSDVFHSYKKDQLNLIVTWDRQHFEDFTVATEIAKKLNLVYKQDRIDLFRLVQRRIRDVEEAKDQVSF